MLVVEVGFKLDKDLEYYDKLLKSNGLENDFNCLTHDIYYSNEELDGLTENEMKQKCIRLRNVNFKDGYKVQNVQNLDLKSDIILEQDLQRFEDEMHQKGYKKVFDTKKKDHHYCKEGMSSKVQLQEIENIGLLVYYDNHIYYDFPLDVQREKLIDELNSYGFSFNCNDLGLDKLRTMYYREERYSKNQNG